jgi:phosphomannomutase
LQTETDLVALIKSISGIRGTIGGKPGSGLTPLDIVRFTSAFGTWLLRSGNGHRVVIGRDGRISGPVVSQLVAQTLVSLGIEVVDLGLSTTPTVEMAVVAESAAGGIILTASHNPREWNALKLLNARGEFISGADGAEVLSMADREDFAYAPIDKLGMVRPGTDAMKHHLDAILAHDLVDAAAIASRDFRIVVDAVNSTGATYVPALLRELGVRQENIILLNGDVNGQFAHNPEPLPENLLQLSSDVVRQRADIGIAVDPDVDRLVLVCEDGSMFGEEYTLVSVADYVLSHRKGDTVSNLSSSRALRVVTERHGGNYHASAVGEVNVVNRMKEVSAVIGGEGNGGIIVPELHYGRDALIGIALVLSQLSRSGKTAAQLRRSYPDFFISKNKIELDPSVNLASVFDKLADRYRSQPINRIDGLRIEFDNGWVHLRASNTEPIIRIIAESDHETSAANMAQRFIRDINECL